MKLTQRIVPDSSNHQPRDTSVPATLILHTNGASNSVSSLYEYIVRQKTRIYPHVQVAWDGSIEQYCPWDKQAYVQYDGNRYAYSAETQDSGYNNKPIDRDPWSDAQLHALAELAVSRGVAPQACTSPTSGGIGYHSQFRAEWNKSGHNCPGFARREQIPIVIQYMTTVVVGGTPTPEDDMLPCVIPVTATPDSTGRFDFYRLIDKGSGRWTVKGYNGAKIVDAGGILDEVALPYPLQAPPVGMAEHGGYVIVVAEDGGTFAYQMAVA